MTNPTELAGHASSLLELGVRTSTFGVGDNYNEELLGQLADAGGGACHDIAGAEGIQTAIGRELGDAMEVVCADTRVYISWRADLRVQVLGVWRSERDGQSLTIHPGDLVSEQELDLLVEVRFPAGPVDTDCPLRALVSDGAQPMAEGEFHWTWADSARRKGQPHNAGVERRVADLLAHQARRDATVRNREGDLQGARERLGAAANDIRHFGGHDGNLRALADALDGEIEQPSRQHEPARHQEQPL